MAEEIVRAINILVENNNKKYVNNQIKNYANNASYSGSSSGGGVIPGYINASQVRGLYNTVAGYIVNAAGAASQGDEIAGRIISTLTGIADVELRSAKLTSAQIQDLNASFGSFIHLVANHATIPDVDAEVVYTDIANIGLAKIDTAIINWAQVEGLTAGTALFTEAAGNYLYADRLVTSDMLIKDSNGNMSRLIINPDTGAVTSQGVVFDGDDILDTSSLSGNKLINGTITADKINITDLFATSAFIANLSAAVITSPKPGETLGTLGAELSKIELTSDRLALILDGSSTSSQIVLTQGMIEAIADRVSIEVSQFDLTAFDEFNTLVGRVSDVEGSITTINQSIDSITQTVSTQGGSITQLQLSVGNINATVFTEDPETGESISVVDQSANKINWMVANGEETSELAITPEALSAIARDIDLTANELISLHSSQIQIVTDNLSDTKEYTDKLSAVYNFDTEGLRTRMTDSSGNESKWSTLVTEDGFFIDHDEVAGHVGAFHEDTFEPRSIRMGRIICQASSGSGWVWKKINNIV